MSYNLENLFDTRNDPDHADDTYLPAVQKQTQHHVQQCNTIKRKDWRDECLFLDWNDKVLHQKMSQLAKAVLSVGNKGPDVLILQEVENKSVLEYWVSTYLSSASYKTIVLIEGDDYRGIDVAVVSRFDRAGSPRLHPVMFEDLSAKQDARGILAVPLKIHGHEVVVYANHFPAPFHPKERRIQSFMALEKLAKTQPGLLHLAAGDFNVPGAEDQKYKILDTYVSPHWVVAHDFCKPKKQCKGTQYYPPKKTWSFLDMILVGHDPRWTVDKLSVNVLKEEWMLTKRGKPKSFSLKTGNGASDHLPLYAEVLFLPEPAAPAKH